MAIEGSEEGCVFPLADLMGPICQTSLETFSECLESCSQLASDSAQRSSQMGKITLFRRPHGQGEGIILSEIS